MSFFGGAQMFQILINLVRGKFVAMILGPEGMGIASLFTSSSTTLQQLAGLGLPTAIVKEVSASSDEARTTESTEAIIAAARRAVLVTACIGAAICIAFSAMLSRWTFGETTYTWQYVLLSIAVMLAMLGSGEMSILQGLHQVKRLSWASVVGASAGLAIGVPLYYLWENNGIVPGIIAVSLASYIFFRISTEKSIGRVDTCVSRDIMRAIIRRLLTIGIVLMAGSLIGALTTYLSNTFIRYFGGTEDVGYFQAANSITNQYAGVVFAAMSVDYFPRLVRAASDNLKVTEIVNRQTEIVALIIAPLVILLMLSSPLLIKIFLTSEFECAVPVVQWMGMGVFLRALAYPPGYIAFAKDNKRLFFILEGIVGNVIYLTANCTCYLLWGLTGLGAAMCATYIISIVIYHAVCGRCYAYRMDSATILTVLPTALSVVAAFLSTIFASELTSNIIMGVLLCIVSAYSIIRLRNRIVSE